MKMTKKKKILLFLAMILVLAAGIWFLVSGWNRAAAYEEAIKRIKDGDPDGAYCLFRELGEYRDAEEQMAELVRKDPALLYRIASKGDKVTFGTYEQDNDPSNGAEPISWIILDRIDNEVLLLSVDCLDCRTYNDTPFEPVTWENSAIRKWLNEDFYTNAFSEEEKQLMMRMENRNDDQSVVGTNGGKDTQDYVYLLSEKEAGIYLGNEIAQSYTGTAFATAYAVQQGAHTDEFGMAEWWLRTPGAYEYTAQFVEPTGVPYTAGAYVDIPYGVRPAIWLNVEPE